MHSMTPTNRFYRALLAAVFAALTTLARTAIIAVVLSLFVWTTGKWCNPFALTVNR